MTLQEFLALTPLLIVVAATLLQMLWLCVARQHLPVLLITVIACIAALLAVHQADYLGEPHGQGMSVTELMVFDHYYAFFAKLILLATLVTALMAYQYFKYSKPQAQGVEEFYILLLLASLGALVLVASQHFASLLLGLEIMAIALFALIAYPVGSLRETNGASRHSLEAAIKYLVLSSVASAFILLGMAFIYSQTGTMSFSGLQDYFDRYGQVLGLFMQLALIMLLVGVAFKLSMVPFHFWTPDVYQGAPTPVTAYIATVSKGAIVAVLLRYFILTESYQYAAVTMVLVWLSIASMIVGNLLALTQLNIKRVLAYSSIAHIGYLFVAFLAAANMQQADALTAYLAVEAVAFYLAAYFVTTLAVFAVVSAVSEHGLLTEDRYALENFRGLFWRKPWVATCFILMLLSLAGIPLTMGFVGKFYIFAAGAQSELWLLLMAVIIGSAIALYYYLRIIMVVVQREKPGQRAEGSFGHMEQGLIFVLTAVLIWYGVFPGGLIGWVQNI